MVFYQYGMSFILRKKINMQAFQGRVGQISFFFCLPCPYCIFSRWKFCSAIFFAIFCKLPTYVNILNICKILQKLFVSTPFFTAPFDNSNCKYHFIHLQIQIIAILQKYLDTEIWGLDPYEQLSRSKFRYLEVVFSRFILLEPEFWSPCSQFLDLNCPILLVNPKTCQFSESYMVELWLLCQ